MSVIRRLQPTGDDTPPWEGVAFIDPIDSDTLHENLKTTYPQCSTRGGRKLVATIDFFIAELNQLKLRDPNFTAPNYVVEPNAFASPQSPGSCGRISETFSCQGSAYSFQSPGSSSVGSAPLERNAPRENLPSGSVLSKLADSSTANVGQQLIFSVVDGHMVQPKTKRKMTSEEKTAYKRRRKVGACPKCKKTKGKCIHDLDEMQGSENAENDKNTLRRRVRAEDASNAHPPTTDHQQSQKSASVLERSTTKTITDGALDKHSLVSDDAQWAVDIQKAGQVNRNGYVQSYEDSRGNPAPGWNDFPGSPLEQNFSSGFPGYGDNPTYSGGGYQQESTQNALDQEFSFHNDFTGYETWHESQTTLPRDANTG